MTIEQITARILDRDYRLSCDADEKPALLAAVARVDRAMRDIRAQGKVTNGERVAVLAALQLASRPGTPEAAEAPVATPRDDAIAGVRDPVADPEIARRMLSIEAQLDDALGRQEPLF